MPKWQFIEALTSGSATSGFEEQQIKNVPGVTTTTSGNPGQLTTISIQGSASRYTKMLWSGLSISETETDAALIPLSTGKAEVVKGIHCAEYGNGAIGGVVNVIPFSMPNGQSGGLKLGAGNYAKSGHLWWSQKTDGFSIQQHIESSDFHGKNSIPKRYQAKYPTEKSPETEKKYFLNQFGFENYHAKTTMQVGLVKSGSTGSNIYLSSPYDSRSKRTLQIYALDLEGKAETFQPYLKFLHAKIIRQDFSPYQTNGSSGVLQNTKVKIGTKIKSDSLIFEPVVEQHRSVLNPTGDKLQKNNEYAFSQGIHLNKNTIQWKNWARVHKANHFNSAYAFSSSLLKKHNDTEFSAHIGTGFQLPNLYMLNDKKYGNKNLKNETAYGGNLGVAQNTNVGTFSVLVFRTDHKQQIDYKNDRYVNLNRSRQKGFELGWKNQIGSWGTQLSCMYAESHSFKPKKTLMNIPKVTANGQVFYTKDDITTSVGWRYTGSQTQPDFEETSSLIKRSGYPVFFGDFQYKFKESATWFVAVENALNRKIESPHGYRNPGFQINTGISITW